MSAQNESLKKGEEIFKILSLEKQSMEILEILHLFKCTAEMADLSFVEGPYNAGSIKNSTIISNKNNS